MASISATISLYDRITAPINNMLSALDNLCASFEQVESSMDGSFDSSAINQARQSIEAAARQTAELGNNHEDYNNQVRESTSLLNGLKGVIGTVLSVQAVKKVGALSDEYVQTTARLGLLVDTEEEVAALQEKIYASAQRSRGSYQDMASSVAKLGLLAGKAFTGTDEIIKFTETLNKNFIVGGASATEQASAMYQLTQAMGSGRLQGDEYRSIIENAPLLAKSIEEYMVKVKGATGTMKEWASEGLLTADVIKAALFKSADDVEEKFNQMPMTWGQVWTGLMNKIYMASVPVLELISFMAQNWSVIEPIVAGLTLTIGLYTAALLVNKGVQLASNIAKTIGTISSIAHGAAITQEMIATTGMTKAQLAFNAALYASPLTWILLIIIAVIAAIYAVVAAINKVTGSTTSATGVIVGAIMTAVAFIWNLFLGLVDFVLGCINALINPWIKWANFFANIFNDPVASIIHLFGDFADNILGVIETIAKGIDKVFGSNLAGAVQGWRSGLNDMVEDAANKYGNGSYEKVANNLNLSSESLGLERWSYSDAYKTGYAWGEGIQDKVGGMFTGDDSVLEDIANTAENTGDVADKLDVTNEDLKYLREIAERDVVNRFTTAEIKVDMTNNNNVSSNMDLDGIVSYLVVGVNEAMERAAEGVYV